MKNNSKRILALLLAIVMCIGCVVPVFAETADAHDHAAEGKCPGKGNYHTEENCTWNEPTEKDVFDPGCGKLGYTKFTCNVCGDNFLDRWVDALTGCDYNIEATAPSCANDGTLTNGYLTVVCKVHTGATEIKVTVADDEAVWTSYGYNRADYIAKHSYDKKSSDNSCLEGGETWEECSVCGHKINEKDVAATGHAYKNVGFINEAGEPSAPTCIADGVAKYVCDNCGDVKYVVVKSTSVNAKHTYDEDDVEVITPADCTNVGVGKVTCTACDMEVSVELPKDATKHDYSVEIPPKDADCENPGNEAGLKCSRCDELKAGTGATIDALGHKWGELVEAVAPTCSKGGNKAYYQCSVCSKYSLDANVVTEENVFLPASHTYDTEGKPTASVAPDCEKFGFDFYTCTICGLLSTNGGSTDELPLDKEGWAAPGVYRYPKLGHDFTVEIKNEAPDCLVGGETIMKCSRCDATQTTTAGPLGHEYTRVVTKVATCHEEGYTIDFCSRCDAFKPVEGRADGKYNITNVDKNNHDVDWIGFVESTPATCTKPGVKLDWCDYCSVYAVDTIPAKGHTYDNVVKDQAPSCVDDGYYSLACSVCYPEDLTAIINIKADAITEDNAVIAHCYDAIEHLYDADKHDAIGHNYLNDDGSIYDHYAESFADCFNNAVMLKICKNDKCGHREPMTKEEVESIGYRFDKYDHYNPLKKESSIKHKIDLPVCGVNGAEYDKCGLCGTKWNEVVIEYDQFNKDHHSAAGINPDSTYPNGVYREPTCEITALYDYKCADCGLQFYYEDTAAGHKYSAVITGTPATCTDTGILDHYTCSECPKLFIMDDNGEYVLVDTVVIDELGHDYGEFIEETPATCEGEGESGHYTCSVCKKNFDAEKKEITGSLVIDAVGHAYGDLIIEDPAECEATGLKAHYHCSACGKYFDENKVEVDYEDLVIDEAGHTYVPVETVRALCTTPGYIRYSCSACGDIAHKAIDSDVDYIDFYTLPVGHTPVAVDDIAPTCTVAGKTGVVKCSACNTILNEGEIVDAGHYNKAGFKIEEKCGDKTEDRVCVNAGCEFNGEPIPAHEFVVTHYDANCVQREYILKVCTECGEWETEDIAPTVADKHANVVTDVVTGATCTSAGESKTWCTACKVVLGTDEIPQVDHKYPDNWTVDSEASIGVAGEQHKDCIYNCGNSIEEDIPALKGITFTYDIYNALNADAAFVNSGKIAFKVYAQAYELDLYNIYLAFAYDSDVLSYAGAEMFYNDVFTSANCVINGKDGIVSINASVDNSENLVDKTYTTDGVEAFAIVYFDIKADVEAGSYNDIITLAEKTANNKFVSSVANAANDSLVSSIADGGKYDTFTKIDSDCDIFALCDTNNDGKFNGQDVVELLNAYQNDTYLASADINKDEVVDFVDYVLLNQLINLKKTYPEICAE